MMRGQCLRVQVERKPYSRYVMHVELPQQFAWADVPSLIRAAAEQSSGGKWLRAHVLTRGWVLCVQPEQQQEATA